MRTQSVDTNIPLPPWGEMDEDLLKDIQDGLIPQDWTPTNGARSEATWQQWRDGEIVPKIEALLWPMYKPDRLNWETAEIRRLFEADFALLKRLRPHLDQPIRGMHSTTVTHADLFVEEDNPTAFGFGQGYERYDPTLPRVCRDGLRQALGEGLRDKVGTLDLQLKALFQRPRPYQVALLRKHAGYTHRNALTANTPSLVSGHCLQSALAGCNAFVRFASSMSAASAEILQQLTVDIGDRRVFAGVHYPSDNMSSWFAALRLIPRVFEPALATKVHAFLWAAINSRSTVFAVIRTHVRDNVDSAYRPMFDELEAIGLENAPPQPT
jgi:hypothetical protein